MENFIFNAVVETHLRSTYQIPMFFLWKIVNRFFWKLVNGKNALSQIFDRVLVMLLLYSRYIPLQSRLNSGINS